MSRPTAQPTVKNANRIGLDPQGAFDPKLPSLARIFSPLLLGHMRQQLADDEFPWTWCRRDIQSLGVIGTLMALGSDRLQLPTGLKT